ncbi:uncharacterized protein LOC103315488 [Nasonia vitripennis]|uniref:Uncharacterized protein n=1 Tax=Nasonia vitripennis TaxID=7425 RepID=A0A7M7H134_NASVI|nr:uncharacterized protein LOC103315488 [Nasonia vitripennis]
MSLGLHYYEDFVAIVPIVTHTSFHIPLNILTCLFVIPAIAVSLIRLNVYLRILSTNPGVFEIIQVLSLERHCLAPRGQVRQFPRNRRLATGHIHQPQLHSISAGRQFRNADDQVSDPTNQRHLHQLHPEA